MEEMCVGPVVTIVVLLSGGEWADRRQGQEAQISHQADGVYLYSTTKYPSYPFVLVRVHFIQKNESSGGLHFIA